MTGPNLVTRNPAAAILTVGLWGFAALLAWRARDRRAMIVHAGLLLAAVIALFSLEHIFGSYFEYTVRWLWIVTGLIVVVSVWTIWSSWTPLRRRLPARTAAMSVLALTVAISASAPSSSPTGRRSPRRRTRRWSQR